MSNSERAMQDAVERRDERDVDLWPEADVVFDLADDVESEPRCSNCGAARPFGYGYEAGPCFDCAACDECAKARKTLKADGGWPLSLARRDLANAMQAMMQGAPRNELEAVRLAADVQRSVTNALRLVDHALAQMNGRRPVASAAR